MRSELRLRSELRFGAACVYYPRHTATTPEREQARAAAIRLKENRIDRATGLPTAERFARFLAGVTAGTAIESFFGDDVTLVPAPRSAILASDALWPALEIARAIQRAGLAREVVPCLERHEAVEKAATSSRGQRTTAARHVETLRYRGGWITTPRVLVVDDIVTRGATLLACAEILDRHGDALSVQAFAAFRTVSAPDGDEWFDPVAGVITRRKKYTYRDP